MVSLLFAPLTIIVTYWFPNFTWLLAIVAPPSQSITSRPSITLIPAMSLSSIITRSCSGIFLTTILASVSPQHFTPLASTTLILLAPLQESATPVVASVVVQLVSTSPLLVDGYHYLWQQTLMDLFEIKGVATGAIAPIYLFPRRGQCLVMCPTWSHWKQVTSGLGSLQPLIRETWNIFQWIYDSTSTLLLVARLAFGRGCNCFQFTGLFCQHSGMPQNFLYLRVFNLGQSLQENHTQRPFWQSLRLCPVYLTNPAICLISAAYMSKGFPDKVTFLSLLQASRTSSENAIFSLFPIPSASTWSFSPISR